MMPIETTRVVGAVDRRPALSEENRTPGDRRLHEQGDVRGPPRRMEVAERFRQEAIDSRDEGHRAVRRKPAGGAADRVQRDERGNGRRDPADADLAVIA